MREKPVPHRRPGQLPGEHEHHIHGVQTIPRVGHKRVDGGPVRDLRRLQADVNGESLDDRACNGEGAGVGPNHHPDEAHDFAKQSGEERHEAQHDGLAVRRAEGHGTQPDERKEPNDERVVAVGRAGEEERQRRPVGGEGARDEEAHEAGLDQDGVLCQHQRHVSKHGEVVPPKAIVRDGVFGHERPEEDDDEVLDCHCDPVYHPPRGVLGYDPRQETCD